MNKLHKSLDFWGHIISVFDEKLKSLEENKGFAEISVTFKIHNGKLMRTVWKDETYDPKSVEYAGGVDGEIERVKSLPQDKV